MNFFDALKQLFQGKLITKKEWGDPAIYCLLRNGRATICLDHSDKDWIITEADTIGDDWYVLGLNNEQN